MKNHMSDSAPNHNYMRPSKRLSELKYAAARAYREYMKIHDASEYSCGGALAAYINPRLGILAREFNRCMAVLKEADANCPDYQPLPEGDK